jgi:hypothetical protein
MKTNQEPAQALLLAAKALDEALDPHNYATSKLAAHWNGHHKYAEEIVQLKQAIHLMEKTK